MENPNVIGPLHQVTKMESCWLTYQHVVGPLKHNTPGVGVVYGVAHDHCAIGIPRHLVVKWVVVIELLTHVVQLHTHKVCLSKTRHHLQYTTMHTFSFGIVDNIVLLKFSFYTEILFGDLLKIPFDLFDCIISSALFRESSSYAKISIFKHNFIF